MEEDIVVITPDLKVINEIIINSMMSGFTEEEVEEKISDYMDTLMEGIDLTKKIIVNLPTGSFEMHKDDKKD